MIGSTIGGLVGGPAGAGLGGDLGYVIATAAATYGLGKRRELARLRSTNGTTATPHASAVHVRQH